MQISAPPPACPAICHAEHAAPLARAVLPSRQPRTARPPCRARSTVRGTASSPAQRTTTLWPSAPRAACCGVSSARSQPSTGQGGRAYGPRGLHERSHRRREVVVAYLIYTKCTSDIAISPRHVLSPQSPPLFPFSLEQQIFLESVKGIIEQLVLAVFSLCLKLRPSASR